MSFKKQVENLILVDFVWLTRRYENLNNAIAVNIEKDPKSELQKTKLENAQFFGAMQIIGEIFQKYAKLTEQSEINNK